MGSFQIFPHHHHAPLPPTSPPNQNVGDKIKGWNGGPRRMSPLASPTLGDSARRKKRKPKGFADLDSTLFNPQIKQSPGRATLPWKWEDYMREWDGDRSMLGSATLEDFILRSVCVLTHFSHVQLRDPMDCSLPGSSVHGILQARVLEWVAMPSSRGSFWPRDRTQVSYISCTGRWFLYH